MNKRKLLIGIPVAAIFLNGLVYLIVSNVRSPTKSVPVGTTGKVGTGATPQGGSEDQGKEADKASDKVRDDERDKEDKAVARRSAGLAALDAGDYEKALIDFTEARALLGDKANVGELLRVTDDLRRHPRPAASPHATGPSPTHVVPRSTPRSPTGHRVAIREEPVVEPAKVQTPPPSGLIIVTTTPRGLLVHVDEAAIDLTPMRTKVRPGSHRVALFDGNRKVYETTLDVKEGGTATLLKDIPTSPDGVSESPHAIPPPAPVAPMAKEESPRLTAAAAPAPAPQPPPTLAASPAAAATDTGALQITSPGLYGVVWVNGRPRGYPPLEVGELAGGPVKIEVRVNGIEKRAMTVVVAPGRTTIVKVR